MDDRDAASRGDGTGGPPEATDEHTGQLEAPFDGDLVADVTARRDVTEARLRELLAGHQRAVRRYTTPEAWVYEVRRAARSDPLVTRQPEAFYLLVAPTVWSGFRETLSATEADLAALRAAHAAAFDAGVGRASDERRPMVVVRDYRDGHES
jgi:hypothetical protein